MARKGNFNLLGKYAWCIPSVADIFILLLLLLLGVLVGNGVAFIFVIALGAEAGMEYATLISYPLMFIPSMIWAAHVSHRNSLNCKGLALDSANFVPHGGVICALLVMAATLAAGIVCDMSTSFLPPMPEWLQKALERMTMGNFWLNLLCVSIFAPFFEEWLCRGMVERGLLGRGVKPVWAIIISALFFALIHMNPWQAIPAFLLGCLFGYVYYRTGSLRLTMLMHFTNNTAALLLTRVPSLEGAESWMDVLGPGYWHCFAGSVILIAMVLLAFSRIPLKRAAGGFDVVEPLFGDVE